MLQLVTDGAADMPPSWTEEYAIHMVPVNIQFGEKTYLQYVDLDNEGFYRLVDETRKIPKTAQPTPHQFAEYYKKIAQKGDTILSIHVTSKLSGTYDSAVAAARELESKFKIIPFDSLIGSAGIGMMCREARIMDRNHKSIDEIVKRMEGIRSKTRIVFALDTLEYARLSGRVGAMQAALASVLNVKPIAVLKDGVLVMADKVRTRRASLERVVEMIKDEVGDQPLNVAIVHARDPKSAQELKDLVGKTLRVRDSVTTDLSISVAANLGPGTVGVICYPLE